MYIDIYIINTYIYIYTINTYVYIYILYIYITGAYVGNGIQYSYRSSITVICIEYWI